LVGLLISSQSLASLIIYVIELSSSLLYTMVAWVKIESVNYNSGRCGFCFSKKKN